MICEYETTVKLKPVGTVGGVASVVTVSDACAVTDPKLFVAVNWYNVVAAGCTVTDVMPVAAPTPLSIVIDVALVTFHDNVPDCPEMIDEGLAVNEAMTGNGSAGVVA